MINLLCIPLLKWQPFCFGGGHLENDLISSGQRFVLKVHVKNYHVNLVLVSPSEEFSQYPAPLLVSHACWLSVLGPTCGKD